MADLRSFRRRLRRLGRSAAWPVQQLTRRSPPPVRGFVRFGSLRRVEPISRVFGIDRGLGIDRYYIERFMRRHAADIRGRVLEIGDDHYSRTIAGWAPETGNRGTIDTVDILHLSGENPNTTIIADLTDGETIESAAFDCIICPQTLQFIFDLRRALATIERILAPGGVLLATASGISQLSRYDVERWGEYWRFTRFSLDRLLEDQFPERSVSSHGNVLVATAFLHGLAAQELRREELDFEDPDYEVLLTARAVKALPH